jgi:peptide/nickel transport system substrate-binding protein
MENVEDVVRLFNQGNISRREFIRRLSVLGLAAATIPSIFTVGQAAELPKSGGNFKQALTGGSSSTTLDPGTLTSSWEGNISWQIRNNLVEVDHNFQCAPELAESWEPSADAATWAFNLRKGVTFHNGKTLDSRDVIYSINYHRGESSKSVAKSMLKNIKDIKAEGDNRVIFYLENGYADLPFVLSDPHLAIIPDGTKGTAFDKGIGTGAYILEEYEPGVRSLAKKNPNYWKQGRGHFDSVETLSVNDANARTSALRTGQIQHMDRCDLKTIDLFEKIKGVDISVVTGTFHYSMPMLLDMAPYGDNDVRMALKLAIDRQDFLDRVLNGYGELGNDHPIAPANRFFANDLRQRQYDPDKARYHLKKAGMQDHEFKLHTSEAAFQGAEGAALVYQEHAKKAGIKLQVVREPSDGYWNDVWTKKEFCMSYWSGRPTEDMMFSLVYAGDASWNETHWNNRKFNDLLIQARKELNDKKRAEQYAEMQQICRDDGGSIIPAFPKIVEANSDTISYGPLSGFYENDGNRNTERWWFA